jgi:hypothetical protein
MNPLSPYISAETQAAWDHYNQAREDVRSQILSNELCRDPKIRAQALYFLQMNEASAFGFYIAPSKAYPNLYIHSIFMPFEITTGQACPDFLYRWGFLDGKRSYRIWGKRGATLWTDMQVQTGHWGDENVRNLGNYRFDDMQHDADGNYEIILSPHRHDGNWIALDPASHNNMLLIREASYGWGEDKHRTMFIECIDRTADDDVTPDEADMNRRLYDAARFLRYSANFSLNTTRMILNSVGTNNFHIIDSSQSDVAGANKASIFFFMAYDIRPDEALIVEFDVPQAEYWGFSLGDVWWAGIDYSYHQSSLNARQATVDSDGKVRAVLALTDPGVPNWVDVVGTLNGVLMMRIYFAKAVPGATTRKVPLHEVRRHLPADTGSVTPEQRAEALQRRARASLIRYGF